MLRSTRLALSLLFGALFAHGADVAGATVLAESVTVLGDSISRAFNSDTSDCNYGDNPSRVWATGDDHGGAFCDAGSDAIFSHGERLECSKGDHVTIFNHAASGADMLNDFRDQATAAKLSLAASLGPRYIAIFMGHNDACTNTVSRTGNSCSGDQDPSNYCRTTPAAFEREFRAGLDQLIQVSDARIFVMATARASELCSFSGMSGCGLTFGLPCGSVWSLPFVDICRSLTDDCSDQRIIDMYDTLVGYNQILDEVTAEYAALPVGGTSSGGAVKAPGVAMRFGDGSFYYKFRSGDVSCCDCFHPADQAQALIADFAYDGFACSPSEPCCEDSGNSLVDGRCDLEDHTSFYPGGFWPFGEACGNGILEPGEQCDDGNLVDGDCCSATCTAEAAGGICSDDGNVCTDDVCDGLGACGHPANTAPCDDGAFCTVSDVCAAGTCGGAPRDCSSEDGQCVLGVCDDVANECASVPRPDGTTCDDGNACTVDACAGGVCDGATVCGDGIVQAGCGEVCDEGAGNGVDGCCSTSCSLVDADTDGLCDRDDPCTGGGVLLDGQLKLRGISLPPGNDKLRLRGEVALSAPIDPRFTGMRILFETQSGPLFDAVLPPLAFDGQRGWTKAIGANVFRYKDRTGTPIAGITRVVLRERFAGGMRYKVKVSGKRSDYAIAPADLPGRLTLVFDPPAAADGSCVEVDIDGTSPPPVCLFSPNGDLVLCR